MPEPFAPPASRSTRTALLAGLAVLLVGGLLAFALLQKPATAPPPALSTAAPTAPAISPQDDTPPIPRPPVQPPAASPAAQQAAPGAGSEPEPVPAWEKQIENVLTANSDESQAAQALLNMLPTLPEEGQIEAANHIANLLPEEKYSQLKPVLLNPATPETVLSVFFTDLMNRDDSVKLRAFLDIAKVPNHPFHEEALSDLQIYVGEDYGSDWGRWSAAVEQYLKSSAVTQ